MFTFLFKASQMFFEGQTIEEFVASLHKHRNQTPNKMTY